MHARSSAGYGFPRRFPSFAAGCALLLALAAGAPRVAQAVPVFDTNVNGGNWNSSATWLENTLPTANVPGSGDSVLIDLFVTVSDARSFGSGSINSEMSGPNPTITINPGQTLTHVAGSTYEIFSTQAYTSNSGTLLNLGTVLNHSSRFLLGYPTNNSKFDNSGASAFFVFDTNNSRLELYSNGTRFNNLSGGTVRVSLPNAADTAFIMGTADVDGQFVQSGNPIDFVKGQLVFAPPNGGTLNDATFASLFGTINAFSELRLGGGWSNITLSGVDLSRVRLGDAANSGPLRTVAGGTTINITAPGGLKFAESTSTYMSLPTGRTMTNAAGSLLVAPGSASLAVYFGGAGTFENLGTVRIERNRFLFGYPAAGSQFSNKGLVEFTQNESRVELYGGGSGMTNQTAGLLKIDMANNSDVARVYAGAGQAVTFQNQGTVEVDRGIFRVEGGFLTSSSWTANSLDEGTWKILAQTGNATLDLQSNLTSAGSITTIGPNAKLVISSLGLNVASFLQLGSVGDVQGALYVHGDHMQTVGASPLTVSGTLGGDGTYNAVDGIVFTGGVLDPSALSGGPGTLKINGNLDLDDTTQLLFSLNTPGVSGSGVNDLVIVDGDLTLDGVLDISGSFEAGTYTLFEYSGNLIDNGLDINLGPWYILNLGVQGQVLIMQVPEPSSCLLLLGLAPMLRRRRTARRSS